MNQRETTIVPIDDCHEILSSFGIGPDSKGYQRWKRDDGFRWVDLEDVLGESKLILGVDWREGLPEVLDTIVDQLQSLDLPITAELEEDGERASIEINGKTLTLAYSSADDGADFGTVIQHINSLIAPLARYRQFQSSIGSDGWQYGLLPAEEWTHLNVHTPDLVKLLFVPD